MTINTMITNLKRDVIRAFATLDSWFDKEDNFFRDEPPDESQRAFHIMNRTRLVNGQLLSLIHNGCKEALQQAKLRNDQFAFEGYIFRDLSIDDPAVRAFLNALHAGTQKAGAADTLDNIRDEMRDQLYRTLCQLELLRNGEGVLHRTDLHESAPDNVDIYQLIHLLSINIWRSVAQLKKLEGDKTIG